jgi:hypothetical protein
MSRGLYGDLFGDRFPLPWQMSLAERFFLIATLEHLKPRVAIEIGIAQGGSLQVLAANATQVYALDTDPTTPTRLAQFTNVDFRIGEAHLTLPPLLAELHAAETRYPFVLIDGNHETDCVRRDIQALLSVPPLDTTYVFMHDVFNPACREGIRTAGWETCPHAHWVNLDVVPGVLHTPANTSALEREMWGGFAVAILHPEVRQRPLTISAQQEMVFRQALAVSAHRLEPRS